jgi:exodeoxyribonuclease III
MSESFLAATWNVNSLRQRLPHLERWLGEAKPDILCLQETKCVDEAFPAADIEAMGYNVLRHGQKTFNGVAILSKRPLEDVLIDLPGDPSDEQARYIEASVPFGTGTLRVASIYLPNGNPPQTEKYPYKLAWMARLKARAAELLTREEPIILAGDYNVIPEAHDAKDPAAWAQDALFLPQTRAAFREIMHLGYYDALRACDDAPGRYTFWDYQAGAWQRDNGIRIDHLLLSSLAADRLQGVSIERQLRGWEKPSDHVPVMARLRLDV